MLKLKHDVIAILVVLILIGTVSTMIPHRIVYASDEEDSSDQSGDQSTDQSSLSPTPNQKHCLAKAFVGGLSASHAGPAGTFAGAFIAGGLCALQK